jgi:predicted lipoprotein with Yx(FWY)xxD motif
MSTRRGAAVLLLVLATSCAADPGPAADDESEAPSASTSPSVSADPSASVTSEPSASPTREPVARGTRIVVEDSEFGPMLFDATGQAIYLFDVEATSEPACYDACAAAWPPVFTKGRPIAGKGVDASLLATTKRADGRFQVTYKGHPLYFYAHEGKYEVLCHDIFLNGGNWYVVQPDGDAAPPG